MKATTKNNIQAIIITGIVLVVLWFGGSAFFDLVGAIYEFLDQYIWAFFAGIIAFLFSISIVGLMFQITVITAAFILAGIGAVITLLEGKKWRR